jgi:hypothetical protein
MTSCHKLEKVIIPLPMEHLNKAEENRYFATIKAIDPDVIEFRDEGF